MALIISLIITLQHFYSYNSRGNINDVMVWGLLFGYPASLVISTLIFLIIIFLFFYLINYQISDGAIKFDKYFGTITYSIYLVHVPVIAIVINIELLNGFFAYFAILILSTFSAIIIYKISEKPFENIRNYNRNYKLYD